MLLLRDPLSKQKQTKEFQDFCRGQGSEHHQAGRRYSFSPTAVCQALEELCWILGYGALGASK
jgi:hypothetical protein